jgi:murein DD-endopeptidase MepM/ murein hydrolase activator NlpD
MCGCHIVGDDCRHRSFQSIRRRVRSPHPASVGVASLNRCCRMSSTLLNQLQTAAASLRPRHPKAVAAGVATALGGFAITAFGLAPLMPDPSDLPRFTVTSQVLPNGLAAHIEALAEHDFPLHRSEATRAGDTADALLQRLGVQDAAASAFLRRDPVARKIVEGRVGKLVRAEVTRSGRLIGLVARSPLAGDGLPTHFQRLVVERSAAAGFSARVEKAALQSTVRFGSGIIESSLFAATDDSRIPDAVAIQMAEIFSTDIDFRRELRKGDRFTVVYEAMTADGEPTPWSQGSGRVLAAQFVNKGHTHTAIWFQTTEGKGGYFDLEGQSKRRALLGSPLEFSRVSSGFGMRLHPIFRTLRAHNGVDYPAPPGTPVRTVGDGVIEFAGWQNGFGNVVEVRHGGSKSTLYAHLSRIDVRKGERVEQGRTIGAVGSTGWSTGPHLHFELKVDGVHRDPQTIAKASETVKLDEKEMPRFSQVAGTVRSKLDVAASLGERFGEGG